jgi:hypothetical protein
MSTPILGGAPAARTVLRDEELRMPAREIRQDVNVHFRLSGPLADEIRRTAAEQGRSLSDVMRRALIESGARRLIARRSVSSRWARCFSRWALCWSRTRAGNRAAEVAIGIGCRETSVPPGARVGTRPILMANIASRLMRDNRIVAAQARKILRWGAVGSQSADQLGERSEAQGSRATPSACSWPARIPRCSATTCR